MLSIVFNKKGEQKARVDFFNVEQNVPEVLQGLFGRHSQQLTEDNLEFKVLWPDLPDQTEWARQMIAEKVETPRVNWEPKKNEGYKGDAHLFRDGGDYDEDRDWPKTYKGGKEVLEEDWELPFDKPGYSGEAEAGRRLSNILRTPITQIWLIMAKQLDEKVVSLKEDYTEDGIKDLYEEYLRSLPESEFLKLVG